MKIPFAAIQSAVALLDQFADFINDYLNENGIQDFINDSEFATVLAMRFGESEAGDKAITEAVANVIKSVM